MNRIEEYVVQTPQRLDVFLSQELDQTRSQVANLIRKEAVFLRGKLITRPGVKLKVDDILRVAFPEVQLQEALEVDFDVEVLYEDEELLVINKPSGVVVHPAPSVKEATLVDWLKKRGISLSTISGEQRHGIVHRLDKGTSGAMVIAKTNEAHLHLSEQLQDKSMGRYYLAVVTPALKENLTLVESNIGRSSHNRLKMATGKEYAKYAKTLFSMLCVSDDEKSQLLACKLFTGRTHQIRVHLESLNRHILGDHIYGLTPKVEKTSRILLHASVIYFIHPKTQEKIMFQAPFDDIIQKHLEKKFTSENIDEITQVHNILHSFSSTL